MWLKNMARILKLCMIVSLQRKKALIGSTVTSQVISAWLCPYAKSSFSFDAVHKKIAVVGLYGLYPKNECHGNVKSKLACHITFFPFFVDCADNGNGYTVYTKYYAPWTDVIIQAGDVYSVVTSLCECTALCSNIASCIIGTYIGPQQRCFLFSTISTSQSTWDRHLFGGNTDYAFVRHCEASNNIGLLHNYNYNILLFHFNTYKTITVMKISYKPR